MQHSGGEKETEANNNNKIRTQDKCVRTHTPCLRATMLLQSSANLRVIFLLATSKLMAFHIMHVVFFIVLFKYIRMYKKNLH